MNRLRDYNQWLNYLKYYCGAYLDDENSLHSTLAACAKLGKKVPEKSAQMCHIEIVEMEKVAGETSAKGRKRDPAMLSTVETFAEMKTEWKVGCTSQFSTKVQSLKGFTNGSSITSLAEDGFVAMLCATQGCSYMVNPSRRFGGYCCGSCWWGGFHKNCKKLTGTGKKAMKNSFRDRLACANPSCRYRVHSEPKFRGYCCNSCFKNNCGLRGFKHGKSCEKECAQKGIPKAATGWFPIECDNYAAQLKAFTSETWEFG